MNLESFLTQFETEEACFNFLFQMKWPNGFVCPRCDHRQAYIMSTRRLPLYECTQCRHQTSLIAGTIMEGSRTDLRKWLTALLLVSDEACGISALQLSKIIQVTYKTAWLMLHKIRHAMSEIDTSVLLSGFVHVNDACYGNPHKSTLKRHPQEQPLLVSASMNDQQEPTYVKMKLIPGSHLQQLHLLHVGEKEFVKQYVEPDAPTIQFVTGRFTSQKKKRLFSHFADARHWINQTFHGLGPRHLQVYLNEFCYRLNQKLQKAPIFERLAHLCLASPRITYADLTLKKTFNSYPYSSSPFI